MKRIFLGLTVLVFITGCQLNEPNLPPWETNWSLYLPTEDFTMVDAIDDDNYLVADTTDDGIPIVSFNIKDTTDWESIDSKDLSIKPEDRHFSGTVDEIKLDKPLDVESDRINLLSLLSDLFPGIGVGDTLPPFDTVTVHPPSQTVSFDNFRFVRVNNGNLYVIFHNDLFLGIRSGLKIDVYDDSLGTYITTFIFNNPIPSGSSQASDPVDLGGKAISNRFRFSYTLPLEGSDQKREITQEMADGSIYTVFSMSNLEVDEAWAIIPEQSFTHHDSVDITDEDYKIRHAVIKKAGAVLRIQNQLPISANIRVEFPNFVKDGQIKVLEQFIEAGANQNISVDFNGYEIINSENPGAFINYVQFDASANVPASNGFIRITSQDSFVVDVTMDSLILSELEGRISDLDVDIEKVSLDSIDAFSDIEGSLRLEDLTLTLYVDNQVNFPIDVQMKITGYHRDDLNGPITDSVTINFNAQILASETSPVTTIVLDKNSTTPSIVDLLEIMPTEISINGQASISGDGSVRDGDGIRIRYAIESPLSFQITEPIYYRSELDSIKKDDIDEDTRQSITEDLLQAGFQLKVTNQLPVGAEAWFVISVDSTDMDSTESDEVWKKLVLKAEIEAAQTDASGYVNQARQSYINKELSQEELQIFKYYPLYFKQTVMINATNQVVRFRQEDGILLDGLIKMKIMVNEEE